MSAEITTPLPKTIEDLRRALFAAYKEAHGTPGISWKSSDGVLRVKYPAFDPEDPNEADFLLPDWIEIYSYLLGPGRMHTIYRSTVTQRRGEASWLAVDVFAAAIELVEEWMVEFRAENK